MASIKGRYEYDDDDLTPGKKKEGGLHQNLFDSEGNLKGSARFIPDEGRTTRSLNPSSPTSRSTCTTRNTSVGASVSGKRTPSWLRR